MAGFPNVTFAFQSPKQKERVDLEADRGIEKYKGKKGKSKKKIKKTVEVKKKKRKYAKYV